MSFSSFRLSGMPFVIGGGGELLILSTMGHLGEHEIRVMALLI